MEPKIGIYICHCGTNISQTIDIDEVVQFSRHLPGVIISRDYKYMCSDPGQEMIKKDIKELGLDRVVVSSCSPLMHELTFRHAVSDAGLNQFLFQMANIREQCSWVHEDRIKATQKAKRLIAAAVSRVIRHEPLQIKEVPVNPNTLVVGAGIAGIEASLQIAQAGKKVYLVEREPSIGGHMAQFDKTFPTLDCAACILTPKMVGVAQNKNIELLSYSEVIEVSGYVGNFKVKIREKPRYVYVNKCTGCAECDKVCPVELPSEFDLALKTKRAIYRSFPQAVPNAFVIDKQPKRSPCRIACPAGCNNHGYVRLISHGKFKEALELIREKIPLPSVCGRVCNAPCEDNCNRNQLDEPVNIRGLKRFVVDLEMNGIIGPPKEASKKIEEKEKVAIVGSGPAGLTCAYDLAKSGYDVTVFEALPQAGGMLRVGIPKFRLSQEAIDYDIEMIKKAGVEILTNTPVGPDLTLKDIFRQGYKAIFIAIGTHKSRELGVEGEDLEGVIHGVGFLRSISTGRKLDFRDKVVAVIGGGNVALDSVRTALRLGAKEAFIIYRRSKEEMPASEEELREAEEEGIKIYYLMAPQRILGDEGRVSGIECSYMKLTDEIDATGRRKVVPDDRRDKVTLKADIVIPAIAQIPDFSFLTEEIRRLELRDEAASSKVKMPAIEGIEYEGVFGFLEFLQAVSLGKEVKIGKSVIVIGGGNVALDVARTTLRLGARNVEMVCLEPREQMPAYKHEIKETEQEGILIHHSKGAKRILGKDGRATGLETLKCVSLFDKEGRFNPQLKEGTEEFYPADTIIVAIGQMVDYTLLKAANGFLITERGYIKVDDLTLATNIPGVFAGGDVIGKEGLVVHAISQGHEAAMSIDRYLRGLDLKEGREKKKEEPIELPKREITPQPREKMPQLPAGERIRNFAEIELGFSQDQAIKEASRCLSCSGCCECSECDKVCEPEAIDHNMTEGIREVEVGTIILATGFELFDATRPSQFGYKRLPNVITGLEFERLSNASGPTQGKILMKNGRLPESVAILHCIGSRDENYNEYCSRVCCMYAMKFSHLVREKVPKSRVFEFYIDLRAFGKGYEEFYKRCLKEDVIFIRGKGAEVTDFAETEEEKGKLIVKCEDTLLGLVRRIPVDMVILCNALEPSSDAKKMANVFGINLSKDGFFLERHPKLAPTQSLADGIFIAGACQGPKDITDTVAQAGLAAVGALSLIDKGKVEIEPITVSCEETVCGGCKICMSVCPYDALKFNELKKIVEVEEAICKGCGTCASVCPSGAARQRMFLDEQIFSEIDGILS